MAVNDQIDGLTDDEAIKVLNRAVSGVAASDPKIAQYKYVSDVWVAVATAVGASSTPLKDYQIGDLSAQASAARAVLHDWASDPFLSERVEAALRADRKVLVEPVTTALVLAGIVIALQTRVSLKVATENGHMKAEFALEKKPTANEIIKKFFALFPAP